MSDAALESAKADARLQMRAARAALRPGDAALELIARFPLELARLSPVAGYWPVGSEIDGRPLLGSSKTTCRLVTRNSLPSRSKRKPVALVNQRSS